MRSVTGLILALVAACGFGLTYWLSVRPGGGWLDGQWLFLAALPYTWTWLHLAGAVDFSPDDYAAVGAALLFDLALAYVAGALAGAVSARLWRRRPRFKSRA